MTEKLLPCPFCGIPPAPIAEQRPFIVRCDMCGIETRQFNNADLAAKRWNTRVGLAPTSPGPGWRPIKTAPTYETILVAGGDAIYPVTACWDGDIQDGWYVDGQEDTHVEIGWPTHWMPLPTFPAVSAEPDALGYAQRLAVSLKKKYPADHAPDWKPLDDILGVLTQIDNITTGLVARSDAMTDDPLYDSRNPNHGRSGGLRIGDDDYAFVKFSGPAMTALEQRKESDNGPSEAQVTADVRAFLETSQGSRATAMTAPVCETCNASFKDGDDYFTTKTGMVHIPRCPTPTPSDAMTDAATERERISLADRIDAWKPTDHLLIFIARERRMLADALRATRPSPAPAAVEALRRIRDFPHNDTMCEQAMAQIAREALPRHDRGEVQS